MRIGIRFRLALLCTFAIVVVVIAVTALQVVETHRAASETIGNTQFALVTSVAGLVDRELESRLQALERVAKIIPPDAMRDTPTGRRFLEDRPVIHGLFGDLFLLSAEGRVVGDWPPKPGRIGVDVSDRQYLKDVRTTRRAVISDPILGRPYGQPQVVFAAPIFGTGGEYLGAVVGSVDILRADVTGGLATEKIGKSGYFFLLANRPFPTLIVHPDKSRIMKPSKSGNPVTMRALAGWEGTEESTSSQGDRVLYSYKRLKATNWIVGARFPYEDAFAPIEAAQVRIAWIGVGLAAMFGLLTWLLVTRILRPLEVLREEIGRGIRQPDYHPRPASLRGDELGDLSRDFAQLMAQRAALNEELVKANIDLDERVAQKTVELQKQADELQLFLYTLGHDLRAPIRAVGAYSELVLREHGNGLDDEARHMLTRCVENSRYMGGLIDGMLELGRLSRLTVAGTTLEAVDVGRIVEKVLAALAVPDKTEVRVGDLQRAHGNELLLTGVLHHLIQNAIKYSGRSEHPIVDIGSERKGGEVTYFIRDNGIGFDMQYSDALFKPFSRLHVEEDFPGNGTGLAIARRSIEILGGRIWAEGTPGGGATFFFTLKPAD